MACWTMKTQQRVECGGCGRLVGPGVIGQTDEIEPKPAALCSACFEGLAPELAEKLRRERNMPP